MKNKIYIALLASVIMYSCQKLDREFITDLSQEQIEVSYDRTTQLLNAAYVELREGFFDIGGTAMMASATDEAEHAQENSAVQNFNNGSWNAINNPNNVWGAYYRGIRRANFFLESIGKVNLDLYKLDPSISQQDVYRTRLYEMERWKYEARFLRAYFYFELVKRYGGVPLITQTLGVENVADTKRNTLEECIEYIKNECDSVASVLIPGPDPNRTPELIPVSYLSTSIYLGRATRGAALALKSKVLLYAASELFNNTSWAGGYPNKDLISLSGSSRTQRWQAASDASLAVINAYGTTSLGNTYPSLFGTTGLSQTEMIFIRRNTASNSFEQANFPVGLQGRSGTNPSQNMVDAYEIRKGTGPTQTAVPFDWTNPIHVANIYTSGTGDNARDPRLDFTIAVNNKQLVNNAGFNRVLQIYTGGLDGKPTPDATKTGYYIKKYINNAPNATGVHSWVFIRMAEVFLNYAEARNELGDLATARDYINRVRSRPGVAMPLIPAGLTQAEIRDRIMHERRVEFAFEDHRAWDVRRWMTAKSVLGAPIRGVNITQLTTAPATFSYVPFEVEQRVFEENKMYLYPIPQADIISSPGLIQNPGW